MCALIYEIAWFREFRLVFGASTSANAAVLAVFVGGLGLGGLLLGKYADRSPRPVVLYAGRIESRKGIPHLLKAFQLLKRNVKAARLVIVGEGGLRAMYMKQAEEMGLEDVTWEDFVAPDYLPSFYQRADVFVSPSTVNPSMLTAVQKADSAVAGCVHV